MYVTHLTRRRRREFETKIKKVSTKLDLEKWEQIITVTVKSEGVIKSNAASSDDSQRSSPGVGDSTSAAPETSISSQATTCKHCGTGGVGGTPLQVASPPPYSS
jgi:hypothetical protein